MLCKLKLNWIKRSLLWRQSQKTYYCLGNSLSTCKSQFQRDYLGISISKLSITIIISIISCPCIRTERIWPLKPRYWLSFCREWAIILPTLIIKMNLVKCVGIICSLQSIYYSPNVLSQIIMKVSNTGTLRN